MLYDLRKILVFLEALRTSPRSLNNVASRVNEKTGELTDDTTRDFIRQQLAAFAVDHAGERKRRQAAAGFPCGRPVASWRISG
ncbi:MAG: hypothetical protein R3D62_02915 [Xanthobacteraceae bacterium]